MINNAIQIITGGLNTDIWGNDQCSIWTAKSDIWRLKYSNRRKHVQAVGMFRTRHINDWLVVAVSIDNFPL